MDPELKSGKTFNCWRAQLCTKHETEQGINVVFQISGTTWPVIEPSLPGLMVRAQPTVPLNQSP